MRKAGFGLRGYLQLNNKYQSDINLSEFICMFNKGCGKKNGRSNLKSADFVAGVVSNNESHFHNQTNQTKINVIENSTCEENESEDDILCEMELR